MRAVAEAMATADLPPVPSASCLGDCHALVAEVPAAAMAEAQRRWAARPLVERLQAVRRCRHAIAAQPQTFADAISPALQRSRADTVATEVLPLLDAMRFLERRAARILATRRLGRAGRPLWLTGIHAEVQRAPFGHVLIIAPANFPLLLAGVQAMQALVAGNAVTWKPGSGGGAVASLLANYLRDAGLPRGILRITGESVEAAKAALADSPDKIIFTGSLESGRKVLHTAAETATPAVMELSGADAVVVLPSADLALAAKAIAFGLRLNGAEVCMSPRRLIATQATLKALRPMLTAEFARVPPVQLKPSTFAQLSSIAGEAIDAGAHINGELSAEAQRPLIIDHADASMAITRSDLFAPVLSLIEAPNVLHIADIVNNCAYALTAAIFGNVREARALGEQLNVGTVLINDLIAPTVDPRVPFGGRGRSGFGSTRGAEGLLEMTAAKTVLVRSRGMTRQYDPVGERELPLFTAMIQTMHGGSFSQRSQGFKRLIAAGRGLMKKA